MAQAEYEENITFQEVHFNKQQWVRHKKNKNTPGCRAGMRSFILRNMCFFTHKNIHPTCQSKKYVVIGNRCWRQKMNLTSQFHICHHLAPPPRLTFGVSCVAGSWVGNKAKHPVGPVGKEPPIQEIHQNSMWLWISLNGLCISLLDEGYFLDVFFPPKPLFASSRYGGWVWQHDSGTQVSHPQWALSTGRPSDRWVWIGFDRDRLVSPTSPGFHRHEI